MSTSETELILNEDGSVYHLHLRDEHIADHVILVGDPGRVKRISNMFDELEYVQHNREFHTHTGTYRGTRITALSTGIGTDNIDIVVNELDAAVNMDPDTRAPRASLRQLNLIRLGTCGALQADLPVDSVTITNYAVGLDGVRHFYDIQPTHEESELEEALASQLDLAPLMNAPYACAADDSLLEIFRSVGQVGLTVTANGFFGPQGRQLRIPIARAGFNDSLTRFRWKEERIHNYEMESSALYVLGRALGHRCLCMCIIIGNRLAGSFSKDYHLPMDYLIKTTLTTLSSKG